MCWFLKEKGHLNTDKILFSNTNKSETMTEKQNLYEVTVVAVKSYLRDSILQR